MTLKELLNQKKPLIMGVLNVTPDSFSDGGKFLDPDQAFEHCLELKADGADIIDIGGESSKPGSESISVSDELKRILPVIEKVKSIQDIKISIDTYKPEVMREVIALGVDLINDIKALSSLDSTQVIQQSEVMISLMHMQGTPKTMQDNPYYQDVNYEVSVFLENQVNHCLQHNIESDRIIIDPGFGFGKTSAHNWTLFNQLESLKKITPAILVGVSRKRMLKEIVGETLTDLDDASAFFSAKAIQKGAKIVRVHNVKKTKQYLDFLS